jgi:hypothetical protein
MVKRLLVKVARDSLVVERHRGAELTWSAEAPITSLADLEAALTGLPALEGWERVRGAVVVLAQSVVQRRFLRDIPPVRPSALREMVALQQARFFRRHASPLATTARWLAADRSTGAEAIATDSDRLDAIARGLESAGVVTLRIHAAADGPELRAPYQRTSAARRRRALNRVLTSVAMLAWCAAPLVHGSRLMRADRRLARELANLAAPAAALRTAQRELASAAFIVAQVDASLREQRTLPGLVSAIVSAVPDSAYINALSLPAGGGGIVTGAAQQPAVLVSRLGMVDGVVEPRADGSFTPEAGPGQWEIFTLRFARRPP